MLDVDSVLTNIYTNDIIAIVDEKFDDLKGKRHNYCVAKYCAIASKISSKPKVIVKNKSFAREYNKNGEVKKEEDIDIIFNVYIDYRRNFFNYIPNSNFINPLF
jgi:hypothetical protein